MLFNFTCKVFKNRTSILKAGTVALRNEQHWENSSLLFPLRKLILFVEFALKINESVEVYS